MKRRTALVSSAVVSVVVLGGAVAAAALSGGGLLGFGTASGGGDSTGSEAFATTQPATGADGSVDPSSDSGVRVRIVEDRVVVPSSGTSRDGDVVRSAVEAALRSRSGFGSVSSDSDDDTPSSVPSAVNPPSTSVYYDDHDEYEEEYEHEEEHEEEYEGHDEHEEEHHD